MGGSPRLLLLTCKKSAFGLFTKFTKTALFNKEEVEREVFLPYNKKQMGHPERKRGM